MALTTSNKQINKLYRERKKREREFIHSKLVKKIRLKKGCDYILVVPINAGLDTYDLENAAEIFAEEGFKVIPMLVDSTRGIKVIEKEEVDES